MSDLANSYLDILGGLILVGLIIYVIASLFSRKK